MTLINQVLAATITPLPGVDFSHITSTAPNIHNDYKITDLLRLNNFDLVNFVFVIIGLIFFANLIVVGWEFMMGSGDPKKISAATTRLINGFIGLMVAILAFVIVRLVTNVLGLGNLV